MIVEYNEQTTSPGGILVGWSLPWPDFELVSDEFGLMPSIPCRWWRRSRQDGNDEEVYAWPSVEKMLESRLEDALVKLVKHVNLVKLVKPWRLY